MRYLITLELNPPHNSLSYVQQLAGLQKVDLDEAYGLVPISPKRHLYIVRVAGELVPEALMALHPEIKAIHGDIHIEPIHSD